MGGGCLVLVAGIFFIKTDISFNTMQSKTGTLTKDLADTEYLANFKSSLPPLREGSDTRFDGLTFMLPKEWRAIETESYSTTDPNTGSSHRGITLKIVPNAQEELYSRRHQIFLPSIEIRNITKFHYTIYQALAPEETFADFKHVTLSDPHCRCTSQLPDRYLKGVPVSAAVFLQGQPPYGVDVLKYLFIQGSDVYAVEFADSHKLPAWFIDDFLDSVK